MSTLFLAAALLLPAADAPSRQTPGLELHLSAESELLTWDAVFVEVKASNVGDEHVRFGPRLMTGYADGTRLHLVVKDLAATKRSETMFPLIPSMVPFCGVRRPELLAPGDELVLASAIGGRPGSIGFRRIFMPAFPHPGRFTIRAVYSDGTNEVHSNLVEIRVSSPRGTKTRTLQALMELEAKAAYWIYEPSIIRLGVSERELEPVIRVADHCGSNRYTDLAALALTHFYHRSGRNWKKGMRRVASKEECVRKASYYLGLVKSPSVLRTQVYAELKQALAESPK